jgi:hypothetical protein
MLKRSVQINDVIVFNPDSFESSRVDSELRNWINCDGIKPWRGSQVPFVSVAGFTSVLDPHVDTLVQGQWDPTKLEWSNVPCDATSCMLVVECEGVYVKLHPLNDDYKPSVTIDNLWISIAIIEHGIHVGILKILP